MNASKKIKFVHLGNQQNFFVKNFSVMSDQRPWLKNYPSGVPANIDENRYDTIVSLVENAFKNYGNKVAFSCMGKSLTYNQVDNKSQLFGAYLQSRGLEPGDKIALMMPNILQYPIALLGALRAGLIVVNTNPLYTPREMKHQFTDAGVKAVLICENFAYNLEKVLPETEIKTVITTSIGELLGIVKSRIVNFVVRNIKKGVPKFNIPNAVSFSDALSQGRKFKLESYQGNPEDIIFLQYTGGTTGVSKGAMLTNRNMVANCLQIKANLATQISTGSGKALCPLPLYHIFALTVNCFAIMDHGGENVLVTNPRDLKSVVATMKAKQVDVMVSLNTLCNALINNKEFGALDFSNLKITVCGGMAVQRVVAEKWEEITGCPMTEGYGLTEASPVVSTNPMNGTGRLGTVGLPMPSTDVRIADEKGNVLGFNEEGEIQVKGPQVMKGYYNRPDETAKVFMDGWLRTGDIGTIDEDGFLKIVDRKKDMILVSGFNVYPNEIEDVVAAHPKVLEVAAIGIPNKKSTEVVKIFVVKKDKSLTEKELIQYCRENLTGYKVPKEVEFRKELPKSNVGKIIRRHLRES